MENLETYDYQISKAMEFSRLATLCTALHEGTTILFEVASSYEPLNDSCKDRGIVAIEQAEYDSDLIDS